jgi:hypothetical protein
LNRQATDKNTSRREIEAQLLKRHNIDELLRDMDKLKRANNPMIYLERVKRYNRRGRSINVGTDIYELRRGDCAMIYKVYHDDKKCRGFFFDDGDLSLTDILKRLQKLNE